MIRETPRGPDSDWIVTGFDCALEAKRRVDALLDSRRVPPLEWLGVTFGHGSSVYVIFDSLLRWTGRGVPNTAVDQITDALVTAFPDRAAYYTHDTRVRACLRRREPRGRGRRRRGRTALLTGLAAGRPKQVGGPVSTRTHPGAF